MKAVHKQNKYDLFIKSDWIQYIIVICSLKVNR